MCGGALADAFGASRSTLLCFVLRIAAFALIIAAQSPAAIIVFGLLYGFTFLITAPLPVVFINNIFGRMRMGTPVGAIGMLHQIAGGAGAWLGGWFYDWQGNYDAAFILMPAL